MNEWLVCPDISVWYELGAVQQAFAAWQSGRQSAKETRATIEAETANLRRE